MGIFIGLVIIGQFIIIVKQHNKIKELYGRVDYVIQKNRKRKGLPL